jgi:hypothetical protein
MQKITSTTELKDAIRQLEYKQTSEERLLKDQFRLARARLTPVNMIKTTLSEAFTAPNLIRTILRAAVGITSGYFSRRYFTSVPGTLLKRLLYRFI